MKTASIRFPATPTKRKVWIGSYGGHFNIIVVFMKKPKKAGKDAYNPGEYCELINKDIIAGKFDQESFNEWFGTDITATEIDIMKVEQYEMTAVWDEYGQIVGLNPRED